jgi:hypothetical protein
MTPYFEPSSFQAKMPAIRKTQEACQQGIPKSPYNHLNYFDKNLQLGWRRRGYQIARIGGVSSLKSEHFHAGTIKAVQKCAVAIVSGVIWCWRKKKDRLEISDALSQAWNAHRARDVQTRWSLAPIRRHRQLRSGVLRHRDLDKSRRSWHEQKAFRVIFKVLDCRPA